MNILIFCLLIAAIIPYLAKIPVVMAMQKSAGGYNNNYPREQASSLQGFGARAYAAHQNSFESLLVFATGVITALATGHVNTFTKTLAVIYIISRIVYHILYLKDIAGLRTLTWSVGLLCSLFILGSCL